MITPNIRLAGKGFGKYFLWGFIIGGIFYYYCNTTDIAVLGNALFGCPPPFETKNGKPATITRSGNIFGSAYCAFVFKVSFYITPMAMLNFRHGQLCFLWFAWGLILFAYTQT